MTFLLGKYKAFYTVASGRTSSINSFPFVKVKRVLDKAQKTDVKLNEVGYATRR
jgi:hypothetical protein